VRSSACFDYYYHLVAVIVVLRAIITDEVPERQEEPLTHSAAATPHPRAADT
jgi:hypothetical protein